MNSCNFTGRICADADLRYTSGGTPAASFTLAVDREYQKNKDSKITDFIYCKSYGNQAEKYIGPYFKKGDMVEIHGEYHIDRREIEGNTKSYHSIKIDYAKILQSKTKKENMTIETQAPYMDKDLHPLNDEDESELPF